MTTLGNITVILRQMGSSMSNPLRFSVYDDGSGDVITSKSEIELFRFEE